MDHIGLVLEPAATLGPAAENNYRISWFLSQIMRGLSTSYRYEYKNARTMGRCSTGKYCI